ncbi:MAG: hypothetical protein H6737_05365 [Alphaproteobacteria bacterium]|nr:hypothetical protein [Alphaproteobacteria bacterium]
MTSDWAAIDIGTSSVKGARFDAHGTVVAHAVRSIPGVVRDGAAVTQDLGAVLAAADAVRDAVGSGAAGLCVTTQRDTAVLDGTLISWMDGRAAAHGSLWDVLDPAGKAVRTLPSAVLERWTGRAVETEASRSARLRDDLDRLRALGCTLPELVPLGEPAGTWNGVPVYPTAGDKNCALLGNGATSEVAGLSLGSAVSLGLRAQGVPKGRPGVFVSHAALHGRWDVETGLVAGMSARDGLAAWLPIDRAPGDFADDLWMLPHFAGALDRPATGVLFGLRADTPPVAIANAWAQGVVAELVRLRPALEAEAGGQITRIRLSGGGAQPGWDALVADAFDVPVERVHGRLAGCRGAVDAVRIAHDLEPLPHPALAVSTTTPANAERFARWAARYVQLFDGLAGL